MIGTSKNTCYACKYCRVLDTKDTEVSYEIIPSTINPIFEYLPVSINLYYGDPLLQKDKTVEYLNLLKEHKHKGPVIIITKGDVDISWLKDFTFSILDLHVAFSTFGIVHKYDNHSHNQFIKNLEVKLSCKRSIEFRSICNGINDSKETIENIFKIAKDYNLAIGYSGLQVKPENVKYWNNNNINLIPYPGYKFGHKKSISDDVQNIFDELSLKYNVNIFRKTSCLISYVHELDRDYNAHYYRLNEMNCDQCIMKEKCFDFKSKLTLNKDNIKHIVPFDFEIAYKDKHQCILKTNNICEFTTPDCSNIHGNIIKINKKITTADVRVIKWLTGYTVDADFFESQYLDDAWKK